MCKLLDDLFSEEMRRNEEHFHGLPPSCISVRGMLGPQHKFVVGGASPVPRVAKQPSMEGFSNEGTLFWYLFSESKFLAFGIRSSLCIHS